MDRSDLEGKVLSELHEVAAEAGIEGYRSLRKEELVDQIMDSATGEAVEGEDIAEGGEPAVSEDPSSPQQKEPEEEKESEVPEPIRADEFWESEPEAHEAEAKEKEQEKDKEKDGETCSGILDLRPEGYGLLRVHGLTESPDDVYISASQIRRLNLRRGDEVSGPLREPRRGERHSALRRVAAVNGVEADGSGEVARFESLTAVAGGKSLGLKLGRSKVKGLKSLESINRGDRVLLKTSSGSLGGEAALEIAKAAVAVKTDYSVHALLIDTPPESATPWEECEGVVVANASYDLPRKNQRLVSELALERCKRMVEKGGDVVLIVDCLTDQGRAYGSDLNAIHQTKRFFGSGRSIADDRGSLTVVATVREDSDLPSDRALTQDLLSIANTVVQLSESG